MLREGSGRSQIKDSLQIPKIETEVQGHAGRTIRKV